MHSCLIWVSWTRKGAPVRRSTLFIYSDIGTRVKKCYYSIFMMLSWACLQFGHMCDRAYCIVKICWKKPLVHPASGVCVHTAKMPTAAPNMLKIHASGGNKIIHFHFKCVLLLFCSLHIKCTKVHVILKWNYYLLH